ncbi:hypothetical protein AGMMS49982_23920 [Bacteroidia bacterium]|nr:hypothetical protein AGMMS49982_23920 [Bacteroidia bacterium]
MCSSAKINTEYLKFDFYNGYATTGLLGGGGAIYPALRYRLYGVIKIVPHTG